MTGCSKIASTMGSIVIMSIQTVSNIKGTADNNPPAGYSSWKDFWEKKSELTANYCHKVGCPNTNNIVGAHVQVEGYGNSWYIVPLCQNDNMSGGSFRAYGPFVPVNPENLIIW